MQFNLNQVTQLIAIIKSDKFNPATFHHLVKVEDIKESDKKLIANALLEKAKSFFSLFDGFIEQASHSHDEKNVTSLTGLSKPFYEATRNFNSSDWVWQ